MKVVGLVSGGKDSCYNMMKCVEAGHQIVCLANLHPAQNLDEIDSYMYQSVGHTGVELYGAACGLPLYRREIGGLPLNTQMEYISTENDEVEDLYELLSSVKNSHPEVEGVSVGAILSNYQKARVENVCTRLGLTPLCLLWEMDQHALLDEMIEAGVNAILIKVAALGLTEKHLGKSLAEVRDHLHRLNSKYGVHVCGEGGEYETFVVDCPLFKKRIVVDEYSVNSSSDDQAPVAYVCFQKLHLEDKS